MEVRKITTAELFTLLQNGKIKTGDCVGFWKPAPISYIIKWVQKLDKKANFNKINHIGCLNLHSKTKNEVLLFVSHQTGAGGKFDRWKIEKNTISSGEHSFYKIYANSSYKKLYIKIFDEKLANEETFTKDQKNQKGKKYGFGWFSFGFPFFSKILGKILNIFYGKEKSWEPDRICSNNAIIASIKGGRRGAEKFYKTNPVPTPEAVMTYDGEGFEGELYEITDFQECLVRTY